MGKKLIALWRILNTPIKLRRRWRIAANVLWVMIGLLFLYALSERLWQFLFVIVALCRWLIERMIGRLAELDQSSFITLVIFAAIWGKLHTIQKLLERRP